VGNNAADDVRLHGLRTILPALLAAACSSTGTDGSVRARAVREARGIRLLFRSDGAGAQGVAPRLRADRGRLEEIAVAPDRRAVSALWTGAGGTVRCDFPYAGGRTLAEGDAEESRPFEYLFLDEAGARVEARLAVPVVRFVPLRVTVPRPPATILFPGRPPIAVAAEGATLELPADDDGALAEGVWEVRVLDEAGGAWRFLVGVDADGGLSAVSGVVRNWG